MNESFDEGYIAGKAIGFSDALRLRKGITADGIRQVIAYLKTTPAVTLSGQGGAYELLEALATKLEEETK